MSTQHETKPPTSEPAAFDHSLDLTGLPMPVAEELRRLVGTLRDNLTPKPGIVASSGETADQWAQRLQAWVDTHPARAIAVDDGRESLYAGRGE